MIFDKFKLRKKDNKFWTQLANTEGIKVKFTGLSSHAVNVTPFFSKVASAAHSKNRGER